jgi:hypothetical protein
LLPFKVTEGAAFVVVAFVVFVFDVAVLVVAVFVAAVFVVAVFVVAAFVVFVFDVADFIVFGFEVVATCSMRQRVMRRTRSTGSGPSCGTWMAAFEVRYPLSSSANATIAAAPG